MAHPKRRTSKYRKRIRRSHLSLDFPQAHSCARCGAPGRSHRVCNNCGYYGFDKDGKKGVEVLVREDAF